MILKLETDRLSAQEGYKGGDGIPPEVEYLDGYTRISAKCTIGGGESVPPRLKLGWREAPETEVWGPMQIMGWRNDEVDVIHVYLHEGDRLYLMNDDGATLDRLYP